MKSDHTVIVAGRNEPCPCGSGQKHKRCCLQRPAPSSNLASHERQQNLNLLADRSTPRLGFETWLDEQVGLSKVYVVRQSDLTKSNFESNFRAAIPTWGDDPDASTMIQYGPEVVLSKNQDLRDELGAYAVTVGDLPGGANRRALVAYAFPVGETLFLYVMNSAAKSVLNADEPENRGNPFTEMLRATVRRLTYLGWEQHGPDWQLQLSIPAHTRLVREQSHGKALWRTLELMNVDLVVDSKHVDPRNKDEEFVFSILSGLSAKELVEIVRRLFNHRMAILDDGLYYASYKLLPFTHTARSYQRTDEGQTWTEFDGHDLVACPETGERLARLIEYALATAEDSPQDAVDWIAVARYAGEELGIQTREPKQVKRGGKPIHHATQQGYSAIRKLLTEDYLRGWMTGEIHTLLKVPHEVRGRAVLWDDTIEIQSDSKKDVRYRIPVRFPAPEIECDLTCHVECPKACESHSGCDLDWHHDLAGNHKESGWPIADYKVERLIEFRRKRQGRGGGGGTGRRRPLAGITHAADYRGYIEDGRQYRLAAASSGRYQVESRPLPDDPTSGWDPVRDGCPDGYPILCSMASSWHRSVGKALEEQLGQIGRRLATLHATQPRGSTDRRLQRRHLEQTLAALEDQLADAANAVKGADIKHSMAIGRANGRLEDSDVLEAQESLDNAKAVRDSTAEKLRLLQERLERADGEAPDAMPNAKTDVFDAAVVAVALQKMEAYADKSWNDILRRHIPPESVRFAVLDAGAQVRWKLAFRVQDVDTGEWFDIPLSGKVENRKQNRDDGGRYRPQIAGELYFRQCWDFDRVASHMGIQPGKRNKNAYLWNLLHDFLRGFVPSKCLRTALIDTPEELVSLRKTIYAHVTGDHAIARGIPHPYQAHIVATYSRPEPELPYAWGWHWVGGVHVYERAMIEAMDDYDDGITVAEAVRATGANTTAVEWTARVSHPGTPGKVVPPRFVDIATDGPRRLAPHQCPHCTTPGKRRIEYCITILWTPETWADAVLCPSCRQAPSLPGIRFPDEYFLPWRGRCGRGSKASGARDAAGTHLDQHYLPTHQDKAA